MASRIHNHSLNALPPGTALGDYVIESELGCGGFSVVYLARHNLTVDDPERTWWVAIKEYLPTEVAGRDRDGLTVRPTRSDLWEAFDEGLRRFKEEALHMVRFQRLGSVVDCLNLFEANGTAYLVMEYDDGLPLSEFLRLREEQGVPCSEDDLMAVMVPLLECLTEVHRAGVLHRDIKPGNIFVRREDDVTGRAAAPMLLDFGAAKQDYLGKHSRSGAPYTPGYAALEQTSSIDRMGPWTDIYALGAVMWRLVAGGSGDPRLFASEESVDPPPGTWNPRPVDAQQRLAAMNWRPPRPDPMPSAVDLGAGRFSPHLLEAVDHCLALYPEDRPRECDELLPLLKAEENEHNWYNEPDDDQDFFETDWNRHVDSVGGLSAFRSGEQQKEGSLPEASLASSAMSPNHHVESVSGLKILRRQREDRAQRLRRIARESSESEPSPPNAEEVTKPDRRPLLRRLASGDLGLGRSYWLYGVLPYAAIAYIAQVMSFEIVVMLYVLLVPYALTVTVGVFKAAEKYGGSRFWAVLARIFSSINCISIVAGAVLLLAAVDY